MDCPSGYCRHGRRRLGVSALWRDAGLGSAGSDGIRSATPADCRVAFTERDGELFGSFGGRADPRASDIASFVLAGAFGATRARATRSGTRSSAGITGATSAATD